jgi:hypothetical protein
MTSISVSGTRTKANRRSARSRPVELPDGPEPWGRRDAVLPGVLIALGVLGLVIGWFGISDAVALERQMRWLALGIVGLIVGGFGMVMWLLFGLVTVGRLRRAVMHEIDRRATAAESLAAPRVQVQAETTAFGAAPGMRHYHRADCLLLQGKQASFAETTEFAEAGLAPCGVCLPADATERGARRA